MRNLLNLCNLLALSVTNVWLQNRRTADVYDL